VLNQKDQILCRSLSKESHSGLMKAVLRSVVDKKGEEKQYIEVRSGIRHMRL
jgi:hypothetical protein